MRCKMAAPLIEAGIYAPKLTAGKPWEDTNQTAHKVMQEVIRKSES